MPTIKETLALWQQSLCPRVDILGLRQRNPIAHKWKATFRSLELRETAFWRIHDLLTQSYELHLAHRALGARILLRSAIETLATLIYLNQATAAVLAGEQNFHEFSDKTAQLLLGSRDKSTGHEALNIITILTKREKVYPGMLTAYASLSETAHPNFGGCLLAILGSTVITTSLSSLIAYRLCTRPRTWKKWSCGISTFNHEYNIEWEQQFERLEAWLVANDEMLERTKPARV